jgi:hypothetical protein
VVDEVPVRDVSRYVARFASDWEAENPRWCEIDGTLVFVDISGFTNLSERLTVFGRIGAEELTSVLDRVFASMLDLAPTRRFVALSAATPCCSPHRSRPPTRRAPPSDVFSRRSNKMPTRSCLHLNLRSGPLRRRPFFRGGDAPERLGSLPVASITTEMVKTARPVRSPWCRRFRVGEGAGGGEVPGALPAPPLLPPVGEAIFGAAIDRLPSPSADIRRGLHRA